MGSQVDFAILSTPSKKVKLCTEEIKTALAEVSVRAQISLEKARKAAQAFSKIFIVTISYKEKYPQQAPKMPKTAEDCSDYVDIFPDKKRLQNKGLTRL